MKLSISRQKWPVLATLAVCLILYAIACVRYDGFSSLSPFINFFAGNTFLGVAAVGMTFVLLSGGIDLSVGAVIGCSSIMIALLIQKAGWHPLAAMGLILLAGTALGATMGSLIHFYDLPPFLVTLAGMFFCRGLGLTISTESVSITHKFYADFLSDISLPLTIPGWGSASISLSLMIFVAVMIVAIWVSLMTRFGRNVYAIGGNENSSMLMGLPVARTKVSIYAVSGFCSALAGVVYTISMSSGNAIACTGLELDAIAAVVVGGTLLSGGVGYMVGTLVGIMIFGVIRSIIDFQGNLSSWWTSIAVGALLLVFILLQKIIQPKASRS